MIYFETVVTYEELSLGGNFSVILKPCRWITHFCEDEKLVNFLNFKSSHDSYLLSK